jgi:hypothetical protein
VIPAVSNGNGDNFRAVKNLVPFRFCAEASGKTPTHVFCTTPLWAMRKPFLYVVRFQIRLVLHVSAMHCNVTCSTAGILHLYHRSQKEYCANACLHFDSRYKLL